MTQLISAALKRLVSVLLTAAGAAMVGVSQAGGVLQTVSDKLKRARYDIEDMGGGAAVLNNSGALAAALASARKIELGEGTYAFTGAPVAGVGFRLVDGRVLCGRGRRLNDAASNLSVNTSAYAANDVFLRAEGSNIIRDMRFVASSAVNGTAVRLSNADEYAFTAGFEVSNVEAYGWNLGFDINNVYGSTVSGLTVQYCKFGFRILPSNDAGDNGYVTTLVFDNLTAQFCTDYGLYISPALSSRPLTFKNLIVQGNSSATGTYQAYMANVSVKVDGFYFEGSPTKYALQLSSVNIMMENGFMNGTGGIFVGAVGCNVKLIQVIGTSANDGVISTGGGANQHFWIEGCVLNGCVFPAGCALTIIDSTINGTYYGYYTTLDLNNSDWTGSAPEGNALRDRRAYTTLVTDTVNAGASKAIIVDHDMGLNVWGAGAVARASISSAYHPGLILTVTPATTGGAQYFCVVATNTTASEINLSAARVNVILERMADYTSF